MNKNTNLLVITNGFPDIKSNRYNCNFVHEYVNLVKEGFKKIYVISPQPYFPKGLNKINRLRTYSQLANFSDYQFENVMVFYPKFFTLPISCFRDNNAIFFKNKIKQVIDKNKLKFDLIHTHFISPPGEATINLKKQFAIKTILTAHGGDVYSWPYLNKQNYQKTIDVISNFDIITVPSKNLKNDLLKICPQAGEKIKVVPNFVDTNHFKILNKTECRKKLNIPADKKVLLNVANIIDGKGHLDLIITMKRLVAANNDILLYIIGTGDQEIPLRQAIKKNNLENYIKLVGSKRNNELPKWYSSADLFVFPSYFESFGIVQIEAMACGVPVVAYDNNGSKEIVVNNDLGGLVKIGDSDSFADEIEKGLKNCWQQDIIRNHIVINFSTSRSADLLLSLYDQFISK